MSGLDRQFVENYLRDCFSRESPPRVVELAERLGLSRSRLHEVFLERFGVRPAAYLKQRQIELAAELLSTTGLTSAQIAYRCGFGTRRTLFRSFQRTLATTPATFRPPDEMSLASGGQCGVQRIKHRK